MTEAWEQTSRSQPFYRVPSVWGCGLWAVVLGKGCRGALAWLDAGPHSCGGSNPAGGVAGNG